MSRIEEALATAVRRRPGPAQLYFEEYVIHRVHRSGSSGSLAFTTTVTRGAGARATASGRLGLSYTSNCGPAGLESVLADAADCARLCSADDRALPDDYGEFRPLSGLEDPSVAGLDQARLEAAMKELCGPVVDQGVALGSAQVEVGHRLVGFAATALAPRSFRASYVTARIQVNGPQGPHMVARTGRALAAVCDPSLSAEAVDQLAVQSAERTTMRGKVPVVLGPSVAAAVLAGVAPIFTVNWDGRIQAGAACASLTDDPHRSEVVGSAPFDGEGVATRRKILVAEGELGDHLSDSAGVLRFGGRAGNAVRMSYRQEPAIGPSVLVLEPGTATPQSLVSQVEDGVHATQVLTCPRLDPMFGMLTVTVAGHRIRRGRLAEPVWGVVLACAAGELFALTAGVADDLRSAPPACAPSMLVESMTVAQSTHPSANGDTAR